MGEAKLGTFTKLDKKLEFSCNIIDVFTQKIKTPANNIVDWILVKQKGGVVSIIPIDSDGKIIFVRQYRITADDYVLEIPAGGLKEDEDKMLGASRELEEETGYKSNKMTELLSAYSSIGFLDEPMTYFLAEDLEKGALNLDEDEYIVVEKYTLEEAISMVYSGKIIDGKTILAIMLYDNYKNKFNK